MIEISVETPEIVMKTQVLRDFFHLDIVYPIGAKGQPGFFSDEIIFRFMRDPRSRTPVGA